MSASSMTADGGRKYWVVKHDLAAFDALPGYIWEAYPESQDPADPPRTYRGGGWTPKSGDQWIAYAHIRSDEDRVGIGLVHSFNQVTGSPEYGPIPITPTKTTPKGYLKLEGWFIPGKVTGKLASPVPLSWTDLERIARQGLGKQGATRAVGKDGYERIVACAREHELSNDCIPRLGRTPRNEREVEIVFEAMVDRLGIEKVVREGARFPDVEAVLRGQTQPIQIELEFASSGFFPHHHPEEMKKRGIAKEDIAVLCWTHDDPKVDDLVHKVFELRELIRTKKPIVW